MKIKLSLCSLVLCACATTNIQPSSDEISILEAEEKPLEEDSLDESTSENESEENNSNEEVEDEEEIEEYEGEENTTSPILISGIWRVSDAGLIGDTCDWDAQIRSFFGVGTDELLPSDFTVFGQEESFEIEANAYGAAGPISCALVDSEFTCEMQSVTPIDFDLGALGWTYAIDFSGVVQNERSLEGTAIVSFPTVSELLVSVFEAVGIDTDQCTQTYTLSLEFDQ